MDASDLLIVIPARGGSKGLPGKNAKTLGDYPLLKWTSDAVAQSGLTGFQCILSTDDNVIAGIGKEAGMDVPFTRPDLLSTDTASAVDVCCHALEWFAAERNFNATYLMLLQPTSPFRPPHVIREAYTMLCKDNTDAVIGVKSIHRSTSTLFHADEHFNMTPLDSEATLITRRQDTRTLYTPNGAMYAIKNETLLEQQTLFPVRKTGIILDQIQSHDIDDSTDWEIATALVNSGLSWRSVPAPSGS